MAFVAVAKTQDIPLGTTKAVTVQGKQILIVNYEGNFYALGRICTHLGGDLAKGTMEGKDVRCPRHGARFDVTTGVVVLGPKIGPLKMSTKDQTIYTVKVEGDSIHVDAG